MGGSVLAAVLCKRGLAGCWAAHRAFFSPRRELALVFLPHAATGWGQCDRMVQYHCCDGVQSRVAGDSGGSQFLSLEVLWLPEQQGFSDVTTDVLD